MCGRMGRSARRGRTPARLGSPMLNRGGAAPDRKLRSGGIGLGGDRQRRECPEHLRVRCDQRNLQLPGQIGRTRSRMRNTPSPAPAPTPVRTAPGTHAPRAASPPRSCTAAPPRAPDPAVYRTPGRCGTHYARAPERTKRHPSRAPPPPPRCAHPRSSGRRSGSSLATITDALPRCALQYPVGERRQRRTLA